MGKHGLEAQPLVLELETVLQKTVACAGLQFDPQAELSIVFADDPFIQDLNRQWRDKDQPTNVLSFPAQDIQPGERAGRLLGDIVISLDTTKREADLENREFNEHLTHLIIHGFLHLFGYDHGTEQQAKTMESLEREILAELNIADPYRND